MSHVTAVSLRPQRLGTEGHTSSNLWTRRLFVQATLTQTGPAAGTAGSAYDFFLTLAEQTIPHSPEGTPTWRDSQWGIKRIEPKNALWRLVTIYIYIYLYIYIYISDIIWPLWFCKSGGVPALIKNSQTDSQDTLSIKLRAFIIFNHFFAEKTMQ